jgi:uncharacterized RDD family membrane protein YckC
MSQHDLHIDPVPRQGRDFQGRRAGVVTRTVAAAIDQLIVMIAVLGTYAGISVLQFLLDPRSFTWPAPSLFSFVLFDWAYLLIYLTVAWATTGRTWGARLMGVRVVSFRGRRLRFGAALVRAAFCVVFPIGLFWCAVNRSNRSVQDVVLRTSVIHDWNNRPGATAVEMAE